ncbi:MAG TPA: threonine/serine dehydratase [Gemmatimonadaceae bacterium]|nr:threonine/serine dehydratase [Gemmatimonadaceae bacterium]
MAHGETRFTLFLTDPATMSLPITIDDIRAARARIAPFLFPAPTPLRAYGELDAAVGHDLRLVVKHENFNPTGSFKIRNGLAFMTALDPEARARGVVAATRGNHGLGIAFAGAAFRVRTTICVPLGNNPAKNAGMRALGARLVEEGRDYDESVQVAERIRRDEGATVAHSTNDPQVIAGAGTMSLEMVEQDPALDAVVLAVGGGSQAVGALTVARALQPALQVFGVQASGAAAAHDSWHAGAPVQRDRAETFADGLATRSAYALTFPALLEGLEDFITVSDAEIAEAMRLLLSSTRTLVEGAGAAGLAGVIRLAERLRGRRVGIVISGGNVDEATLRRVLNREI